MHTESSVESSRCEAVGSAAAVGLSERWYAAQVWAGQERPIKGSLERQAIEVFLPTYRKESRWSDRIKFSDVPLFAGYLFVKLPNGGKLPGIRGLVRLVGVGATPTPIDERQIEVVRRLAESQLPAAPHPYIAGEAVRIERGPMAGMDAIVMRRKNGFRVVVSVALLRRSVAVEMDSEMVSPCCVDPHNSLKGPVGQGGLLPHAGTHL